MHNFPTQASFHQRHRLHSPAISIYYIPLRVPPFDPEWVGDGLCLVTVNRKHELPRPGTGMAGI